jgi:hypothetical protein
MSRDFARSEALRDNLDNLGNSRQISSRSNKICATFVSGTQKSWGYTGCAIEYGAGATS